MNFSRQLGAFNKEAFNKKHSVTVIGAGAGGSHLVYNLAKMGVENMKVYDFDIVEEHNIPNQLYGIDNISSPKVLALDIIISHMLYENKIKPAIQCFTEKYTAEHASKETSSIVYLAVDTMASRKEIFEALMKNGNVEYVIDGRMGADTLRVYFIPMYSSRKVKLYCDSLYTDEEAQTSLCGTSISVGATASLLASLKAWQVIRIQRDTDDVTWWEMFFDVERMTAVTF